LITLRQEAITSEGRIKRWCRPGGGVVLYQMRLTLDGDAAEVASMERVIYRVAGPDGVIEVTATRPERNFAAALWAMTPAAVTVLLSSPAWLSLSAAGPCRSSSGCSGSGWSSPSGSPMSACTTNPFPPAGHPPPLYRIAGLRAPEPSSATRTAGAESMNLSGEANE